MITEQDRVHLQRCIELASEALQAGDAPFGSVLVAGSGALHIFPANYLKRDKNLACSDH